MAGETAFRGAFTGNACWETLVPQMCDREKAIRVNGWLFKLLPANFTDFLKQQGIIGKEFLHFNKLV